MEVCAYVCLCQNCDDWCPTVYSIRLFYKCTCLASACFVFMRTTWMPAYTIVSNNPEMNVCILAVFAKTGTSTSIIIPHFHPRLSLALEVIQMYSTMFCSSAWQTHWSLFIEIKINNYVIFEDRPHPNLTIYPVKSSQHTRVHSTLDSVFAKLSTPPISRRVVIARHSLLKDIVD